MEESDLEDLDRFRGHERKGGRYLDGGERVKSRWQVPPQASVSISSI